MSSPRQRWPVDILKGVLIALVLGGLLLAVLSARVRERERVAEELFGHLWVHSARIDPSVLLSAETAIGARNADDHVVALRLGDALVRWQVGRQAGLASAEQGELSTQLKLWLSKTDLRGTGAEWASALSTDDSGGAETPPPQALRSLRRSLPDGKVEAGRWLAAIRLLSLEQSTELSLAQRKAAFAVLDGAQLMRTADDRLPVLLTQETLSTDERLELAALATEMLLQAQPN